MLDNKSDRVKAYIYNEEGQHSPPIYISHDPIQIASFIIKTKDSPRIVITDTMDEFELDTIYGFIDRCIDQYYLNNQLLDILIPMQEGKLKPHKLNILSWGVNEEFNKDSIMIPFIKEKLGIDLD